MMNFALKMMNLEECCIQFEMIWQPAGGHKATVLLPGTFTRIPGFPVENAIKTWNLPGFLEFFIEIFENYGEIRHTVRPD